MATPQTPYEAVLNAARDVSKLDCALDAEMLGTALLGSVYAIAEEDRAGAVRAFVGGFLTATARRRTVSATTIRTVFASLVPDAPGASTVKPGAQAPSWSEQLGKVRVTGTYAYGDVYGDQTSYLATFAYEDDESGGPEHAVVALVDHNIGITKDVFVGGPAERILRPGAPDVRRGRADLVPRGGPAAAARRGGQAPADHRRARRPAVGGLAGDRPGAGRRPARAAADAGARGRARPARADALRAARQARARVPRLSGGGPRRPRQGARGRPRLAALLHQPGARPRGEHARRRPDALEPGGRRALPARLGAPARRPRHGRRRAAAAGGARAGRRTRRGRAACPTRRRPPPTRRSRRWCRSSRGSTRPASGAARRRRRWRS